MTLPFVDGQVPKAADFNQLLDITSQNAAATAADRVQTGQDRDSANASAGAAAASSSAASTQSGIATTQAGISTAQASDSAASASVAMASLNDFKGRWYGALSADPTLNPLGAAPNVGDAYFNSMTNLLKIYNGATWQASDINTANLAASTGATLVGYGASTVKAQLDTNANNITEARDYNDQIPSALPSLDYRVGDLSAFFNAIRNGAATVVFWGDSITEGVSQVCYEDSWAGVLERALRLQNPGVTWTFVNLSLAGRGIQNAQDSAYTGKAAPDDTIATNFYHAAVGGATSLWPTGSVIGKAWRDHVKDAIPDLVIFAFGANDISGSSAPWATFLKNVKSFISTFAKVPSLAVVPTALPLSTDPTFGPLAENINVTAIAARGVCEETNLTNIDANRMQQLLCTAKDVVNEKYSQELDFYNYPTGWTVVAGTPTFASAQLSGPGMVRRLRLARNTRINCTFNLASYSTGTPGIWYRGDSVSANKAYALQVAGGTTAILYYNLVSIASVTLTTALTNGQDVRIEVEVVGAHHRAWVNGQKVIDLYDYQALTAGYQNIQIDTSTGVAKSLIMRFGVPTKAGNPKFTETQLLGSVNDFATNPDSVGGDAIHHPSKLGHSLMYVAAAAGLLNAAKRAATPGPVGSITQTVYNTTWAPAVNDYIDLRIGGVSLGNALVSGASGALNTSSSNSKLVAGGQTVVVDVLVNGTTVQMTTSLVLPTGQWRIDARVDVTQNGAGVRHIIVATATRVA